MSRNNHYHYAEKYEEKRARVRRRGMRRLPVKSAIFTLLMLFAFGLVSTTFATYVTASGDGVIDGYVECTNGVVLNVKNRKVDDDTLIYTGADADLASTGANVTLYFQPADSWITSNYTFKVNIKWATDTWNSYAMSFAGLMMNGRPIYKASVNSANIYNLQFQAYDGNTYKGQYEVYAGSSKAISNFAGVNKIWYGAGSSDYGSPDGFTLYNEGNAFATFSLASSNDKYTTTVTLNRGTTYKFDVYNGNYPVGSKRFQCGAKTMTATGTEQMYAYTTANNNNTITITPTVTASFTFEWTLNNDRNQTDNYKWAINSGNLTITFPTTRTITVKQYKDNTSTSLLGTVAVGGTDITTQGGTAVILNNTATSVSIDAPNGYAFTGSTPSASSGTLSRTSGQTSNNKWTGTITTSADSTITIRYSEVTKTVTINTNNPGTVATSNSSDVPAASSFTASTTATVGVTTGKYVFAKANTGFEFLQWSYTSGTIALSGDTTPSTGYRRVLLKGNGDAAAATLQAQFQLKKPTVTSAGYSGYGFTGVAVTSSPTATSATGTAPASWSYAYTLDSKPSGSTAAINPTVGSFTPDLPGTYTVSVKATDSQTVGGTAFSRQSDAVTATITVYQSPTLTIGVTATDGSTFEGNNTPGDPYIFVIHQPLKESITLSNYDRTNLTYQWAKDLDINDDPIWENDPQDDNQNYTNLYEFENLDTTTNTTHLYLDTTSPATGRSYTAYCKAYVTSDPTIYTIVPAVVYYNVSSEILRVDDLYFMEDKGDGFAKYTTPHQKIYPVNSAALAMDITYGGSSFQSTVKFNKDRTTTYTDIFTQAAADATATPITQFFFFPGEGVTPTAFQSALQSIYTNYTAPAGVKRFKVTVTDDQNLSAEAGPIDTVVGTREVAGSKSVYFYTASSLTNVRNIVILYKLDDAWYFQNGQVISAGYYRFNVPAAVTNVYFFAAKNGRYGMPTVSGNTITWGSDYYTARTADAVTFESGKPKYTATISGTTISGTVSAL